MKTPNIGQIKRIAVSCRAAVNAYLMAKAYAKTWGDRVEPIQREGLDFVQARYEAGDPPSAEDGQLITDPAHAWRMSDEQAEEFYTWLDAEYRSRGWLDSKDDRGTCPALKAEHLQRLAGRAVLLSASEIIEVFAPDGLLCAGLESYRNALDLVCRIVVNHPGYSRPKAVRS